MRLSTRLTSETRGKTSGFNDIATQAPIYLKYSSPMMEELLSSNKSYTPVTWFVKVREKARDPNGRYIVTAVSHYKQRSSWPNSQPEYVALLVQPPPDQPQPALAPFLIKVSRDPLASRPSRYRLWGATDDRVTILGPAANVELHDERLHYLRWSADEAPPLEIISTFIHLVHVNLPQNCLWLDKCCYAFARALVQAVHYAYNGIPSAWRARILVPNCLLVTIMPGSHIMTSCKLLINEIATEVDVSPAAFLEEADKEGYPQGLSEWVMYVLACIIPVRVASVRFVAFCVPFT